LVPDIVSVVTLQFAAIFRASTAKAVAWCADDWEGLKGMTNDVAHETPESKKAVFRSLVDIYARGAVDELEKFVAPDYVGHTAAGARDLAEFRKSIINFHAIFDYSADSFVVEDQFAEGDKVATRMTAHVRMRHTGEPVTMLGINVAVIRNGKIFEEWNTWEMLKTSAPNADASVSPFRGSLSTWG
jgi:ketosteroid isomerase-like protein